MIFEDNFQKPNTTFFYKMYQLLMKLKITAFHVVTEMFC